MKLLAIETSTMLGGVAIIDEASFIIAEARLNVRTTHSERLMTEIDHCLKQAGMDLSDIDVFAVSIGPGSFTGLRIGLGTIKGLCYATGKPVVTVPTLEAFAWNFPMSPYPLCLLLDARKKEVYAGLFLWKADSMERQMPEASLSIGELIAQINGSSGYEKIIFAGEGALIYKKEILETLGSRAVFAPMHLMVPLPSSTAYLGMKKALAGEFEEPSALSPLYIRKAEAELKADAK